VQIEVVSSFPEIGAIYWRTGSFISLPFFHLGASLRYLLRGYVEINSLRTALFWVITQQVVIIPYRRFGTTIGPIYKGQDMELICCSETSVRNYHYSLRNNPEERSSHLLSGGSLKSRKLQPV
jgi:hypothetical protein